MHSQRITSALFLLIRYAANPADCVATDPWTYIWASANKSYCEIRHTARAWRLVSATQAATLASPPKHVIDNISGYAPSSVLSAAETLPQGVLVAAHSGMTGTGGTAVVGFHKWNGSGWAAPVIATGLRVNYGHTLDFKISPSDPDLIYLTGVLLTISTDGGRTFSTMGQSYWDFLTVPRWAGSHPDVRAIFLRGTGPGGDQVYFGTDGGVSRTIDSLASTQNLNGEGLHLAEVQGIGIAASRPSLIAFGTQHNGFFSNRDHVWDNYPYGDFYDAVVFDSGPGEVTAMTTMNSTPIRFSAGAGVNLTSQSCPEETCIDSELMLGRDHVFLGQRSVWKRSFNGSSWDPVASLANCTTVSGLATVADDSVLYATCADPLWSGDPAATLKGRVFRISSPTGNANSVDITAGLSGVAWQGITDVATDVDGSVVFVALGGFGNGVFRRPSGGTWSPWADGLPAVPVNALAYDRDSCSLFAGTDVGVFVRTPYSDGWVDFSPRVPLTNVSDLEIDPITRKLVASTFGQGVWEARLASADALSNYCRPIIIDDNPTNLDPSPHF